MDDMTGIGTSGEKELDRPGGNGELAGRLVGRVGFGAMQLPGPGVFGPPRDRATALAVLRRVVDLGINHIDTAQFYGPDVANELIHEALFPYPEDLVLVSKVGARRDEKGGWAPAQRPEELRDGVEANLSSLGVQQVGVVNLRLHSDPNEEGHGGEVDFDSQLAEMVALRDEGKIGAIGLSNVSLDQLRHALPAGIACVQNAYSVLDRSSEPLLDICRERAIAWAPFFPLGSAFPWVPKVTEQPAVVAAAAALGVTPAQVGLAWLLGHDPHVGDVDLSQETVHVLDGLAGS
jgi:aryl-alcohol dehydrogenase-like predicted oxidoreductase